MKKLFILILLFLPIFALAEAPTISSVKLNGSSGNVTFNPNAGEELNIELSSNQPVKFGTIAICLESVSICNRTASFKYFTQTTSLSSSVVKNWNGKNSSEEIIPEGVYKINVTMTNEAGESNNQELSPRINVTSSGTNNNNSNTNTTQQTTTTSTTTSAWSSHTGPAILSDYGEEKKFKVGAGRERLATVKTPIVFEASRNRIGGIENLFRWSFGDGTSALGRKVYHTYQFPGRYQVVLNAVIDREEEATARTVVTVTEPRLRLAEINPTLGYVEVANDSAEEQNLNHWSLRSLNGVFSYYLPLDTIIDAESSIKIPLNAVGFNPASGQEIALVYPGVSETGVNLAAQIKAEKIMALQKQLQSLRQQLAQAQIQSQIVSNSNRVPVVSATAPAVEASAEPKNVVILKQKPGWAERIKDVLFN